MGRNPPTLLTSRLSQADFALRIAFFTLAPFAIVIVAELFPVRGALIDAGLALGVFIAGEAVRKWASQRPLINRVLGQALAFEKFYREKPPRPFAYYCFYPFLCPYWLYNREARREFLVFRSYTVTSFAVLVISLVWQYFSYWRPQLGIAAFLPSVLLTLAIETLLVLSLLMPITTTVVWYHATFRRGRLAIVFLAGLLSTGLALARVARRRDPIVSYFARERVRLRTAVAPKQAHRAVLAAAHAAFAEMPKVRGVEGDGKVEGAPLDRARDALETFYKHDEAYAFDLWASPRKKPRVLVAYFPSRRGNPPIWVAVGADGKEIRSPSDLPTTAFQAMRNAADGADVVRAVWPTDID